MFSDVLELVSDHIMLNIEIKRSGEPKKTAEKVVELVEEYGLVHSCYITSFSYPALKKVKQLNPKVVTDFEKMTVRWDGGLISLDSEE